jgi:hypothetical protein
MATARVAAAVAALFATAALDTAGFAVIGAAAAHSGSRTTAAAAGTHAAGVADAGRTPANGAAAMSGTEGLDLRAELARIDRDRAETEKLTAEQRKHNAEAQALLAPQMRDGADIRKLVAEQLKLLDEQIKLQREWRRALWWAWLGVAGGVVTLIGAELLVIGH